MIPETQTEVIPETQGIGSTQTVPKTQTQSYSYWWLKWYFLSVHALMKKLSRKVENWEKWRIFLFILNFLRRNVQFNCLVNLKRADRIKLKSM